MLAARLTMLPVRILLLLASVLASALLAFASASSAQTSVAAAATCPALLDREFNRLQTGKPDSLWKHSNTPC
jgi:hypothetical protein